MLLTKAKFYTLENHGLETQSYEGHREMAQMSYHKNKIPLGF